MDKKLSLQEWRDRAQEYSNEVGCPDDLWTEDDPYELSEVSLRDYEAGVPPEEFIRDIFADDLAAMEGDDQLFNDSLLYDDSNE
jgi:hypothetical protein